MHCMIHRQQLVSKNKIPELHNCLQVCIRAINRIKSNMLHSRLFARLCEENDDAFRQLLLYTEVRWLLKGLSLHRLVELTIEFLFEAEPYLEKELKLQTSSVLQG